MNARFNLMNVNPGIFQAMLGLEKQVSKGGFDTKLLDLIRMRASQINGCAYCLDMHSKDAAPPARPSSGSTASTPGARRRSTRTRARRARMDRGADARHGRPVPDDVYERVRQQFSEDELAHLSLAIVAINGWNRLNVAARTDPGDYVPGSLATHTTG